MAYQAPALEDGDDEDGFSFEPAVRQALRSRHFPEFVDWLSREIAEERFGPMAGAMAGDPAATRAMAMMIGRTLWNAIPRPDNDFRPLTVPKPDRNGPCPCGSGKKFKRCCGMLDLPPLEMEDLSLLGTVLDTLPRESWSSIPFRRLSPEEVAFTAGEWREDDRLEDAALLLESLFAAVPKPDERFEPAFDTLMDVYLDLGMEDRRVELIRRMVGGPNQRLRSAALHRQCTIHADRGEWNDAWRAFAEAQRQEPDNPSLSHLEVIMLASQGRLEEASKRARFWASHWSRRGEEFAELVEVLRELAEDPQAMLDRARGGDPDEEEGEHWELDALWDTIDELPEPELHYHLEVQGHSAGALSHNKSLEKLEQGWSKVFDGGGRNLELFGSDPAAAWQNPQPWLDWLADHPHAFDSFRVLDDLVATIDAFPEPSVDAFDMVEQLAERAERLLRETIAASGAEGKTLDWGFIENRPALRLMARLAQDMDLTEDPRATAMLEWLVLELNPTDNQGLRNALARRYLEEGRPAETLALCERYPGDVSELPYARVIALHRLGRLDEAAAAFAAAREQWPEAFDALVAQDPDFGDVFDPDALGAEAELADESGEQAEGEEEPEEAWRYGVMWLPLWQTGGALEWAKRIASL